MAAIEVSPGVWSDDCKHFESFAAPIRSLGTEMLPQIFGERCSEYDADCVCCQKWKALDFLLENPWREQPKETSDG